MGAHRHMPLPRAKCKDEITSLQLHLGSHKNNKNVATGRVSRVMGLWPALRPGPGLGSFTALP